MQDRTHLTSGKQSASPHLSNAKALEALENSAEENPLPAPATPAAEEPSRLDQSLTSLKETLDEHKGKLAISAAAMLGLLVYYKWGEKSLAKEDPEEYERLQRIKERVRQADELKRPQRSANGSDSTSDQS